VAIQPPRVEYSNDCGKWRRVRGGSRSWSSRSGPSRRPDARGPRLGVDLEHPIEPSKVDRDRAAVTVADPRLDPTDHAGPAAVGDRRRALLLAERQHCFDLRLVAWPGDEVGRVWELAANAADHVAVGLAEPVAESLWRRR
jgi:hypothetical protein